MRRYGVVLLLSCIGLRRNVARPGDASRQRAVLDDDSCQAPLMLGLTACGSNSPTTPSGQNSPPPQQQTYTVTGTITCRNGHNSRRDSPR
jgi:hypothetical protein